VTLKGMEIEEAHVVAEREAAEMLLSPFSRDEQILLIALIERLVGGEALPLPPVHAPPKVSPSLRGVSTAHSPSKPLSS
jgi:hypothetical protein